MTAEALAETYAAAFAGTRPWSAAEINSLLASPGAFLVGNSTCFLIGRVTADEAEILTLATHPSAQRQGNARRILTGFEDQIRGSVKNVFLEVDETNTAARALYDSFGYEQLGIRRGYYHQKGRAAGNALVLGKILT